MNSKVQVILIALMFLGLILASAGVGALLAGESTFGTIFSIAGAFFLLLDVFLLFYVKNAAKARQNASTEPVAAPAPDAEQEAE